MFLFLSLLQAAFCQSNDACESATPIILGEKVFFNNQQATADPDEAPEGYPISCIESFENDLWFSFESVEGIAYYEVQIVPISCNTPAGLQAVLFEGNSCQQAEFVYRDCANPHSMDMLKLSVAAGKADIPYLLYVDGYDGTECEFSISLLPGGPEEKLTDLRAEKVDYSPAEVEYEPEGLLINFQNNEVNLQWEDEVVESEVYFQVQEVVKNASREVAWVRETVEAVPTVLGKAHIYRFTDTRAFKDNQTYCFRVVKIKGNGDRSYSEAYCVTATNVQDFFVHPPAQTQDTRTYAIHYTNKKKQTLLFSLLDENQVVLKQLERLKEPIHQNLISLDMTPYPSGKYFLKVEGKKGTFLRAFFIE